MEPPYRLIRDRLEQGKVVPFLGAGASFGERPEGAVWKSPEESAFLPSGSELAAYLEELSGYPSEADAELARVAQFFDGVAGRGSLNDELRGVFSKAYRPSRLHRYLADCAPLLIVTTNYDDLLEDAYDEKGKPYYLVVYKTGEPKLLVRGPGGGATEEVVPNELDLPLDEASVIFKMHGAPSEDDPERDSFVITEDDYVEFLARMTSRTAIPAVFAEPFQKRHFLFFGYSLKDWNLRVVLYRIFKLRRSQHKYASWAIQYRAEPLEQQFWSQRMLHIYELSIDAFLDKLLEGAG